MDGLVARIAHPVPVRWIPRGGRHERLSFRAGLVQARIRAVPASALGPPIVPVGRAPVFQAFEGRLWTRIGKAGNGHGLTTEAFLRFVGDPGRLSVLSAQTQFEEAHEGSPLAANGNAVLDAAEWAPVGDEPLPGLVEDLGPAAGAAARAMAQDGLLSVDGFAYRRAQAPAMYGFAAPFIDTVPTRAFTVELDAVDALARFVARLAPDREPSPPSHARVRDAILAAAPGAFAGDDVLRFANALPRMLHAEAARGWGPGRMREGIDRDLADRLRALNARGCVGLVDLDGIDAVLAVARETLAALPPAGPECVPGKAGPHWIEPWIEEVVAPRLARLRPLPDEDGLALGSLAR